MSASPIYIQQDLYCIGTTKSRKFSDWPRTKVTIHDRIVMIMTLSSLLLPLHHHRHHHHHNHPQYHHHAITTPSSPSSSSLSPSPSSSPPSPPSPPQPTTQPRTRMNEDYEKLKLEDSYEYGCVRKVAERGFPYDFNIDRKCVWKFCLFEQFTGSATSAQDKERTSQRIMQEATMRLKLSRLAREGGRVRETCWHSDMILSSFCSKII